MCLPFWWWPVLSWSELVLLLQIRPLGPLPTGEQYRLQSESKAFQLYMYNLDSKQKILTSCIRKFCTTVNLHKSSPRQGSLIIYKAYLDCCFSRGRLVFSFHKYCIEISFFIPQLLAWLLIIHDLYITRTHHFTS